MLAVLWLWSRFCCCSLSGLDPLRSRACSILIMGPGSLPAIAKRLAPPCLFMVVALQSVISCCYCGSFLLLPAVSCLCASALSGVSVSHGRDDCGVSAVVGLGMMAMHMC